MEERAFSLICLPIERAPSSTSLYANNLFPLAFVYIKTENFRAIKLSDNFLSESLFVRSLFVRNMVLSESFKFFEMGKHKEIDQIKVATFLKT